MNQDEIDKALRERFGDKILPAAKAEAGDPWIGVRADALADVCRRLRDDPQLDFDLLMSLSGVDYLPEAKLGVTVHLWSVRRKHALVLKAFADRENPRVPSVDSIWPAANWHEREAYDLYGIVFEGSRDLRRILLPKEWVGFPGRKDYVLPEDFQGFNLT